MKTLCLMLTLIVPGAALAQAEPPPLDAKAEKHLRTLRTLMLVDALDLDLGQAQTLDNNMATYDARKKPLLERMHSAHEQLQKAARGELGPASQVDALVNELSDLESQLHKLDHEMYLDLSKNMTAQQKARFAPLAMHPMPPPHAGQQLPQGAPANAPPPLEAP
ncbi:MAG: periplasmic heavy metal sensor [Deltaproteobacteria bacterium]|nr:periplasmic heavy metal sensor [Deltaproteobacteria bacterium]